MIANPFQEFEAVHLGHFEVEQYQVREREFGALPIFSDSLEVGLRLRTVSDG
jgi:hypothetical protein